MKNIILYSILLFCSCRQNKKTGTLASEVTTENHAQSLVPGCYQMIIDKDSALMNLSVNGNRVSGTLMYNRFEKDDNAGDFTGTIDSNRIIAWYNFQAEGMVSVRQLIFKISNNTIEEGYGDIGLNGDTAYFKYPHAMNYESGHPYKKIDCK